MALALRLIARRLCTSSTATIRQSSLAPSYPAPKVPYYFTTRQIVKAVDDVGKVTALLEPPTLLQTVVCSLLDIPGVRTQHWAVVSELEANPFLPGRNELIRALAHRAPFDQDRTIPYFESHAHAIARSVELFSRQARNRLFDHAVRMRFPTATFMSLRDIWTALSLWPDQPSGPIIAYLKQFSVNVHRMQTTWESEGLRVAKSSLAAERARAADTLYAFERDIVVRFPDLLREAFPRILLLEAYTVLRAEPVHAARHWAWLAARPETLSARVIDSGLRSARNADDLQRVWDDSRPGWGNLRNSNALLAGHYARIGNVNLARRLAEQPCTPFVWQLYARTGRDPPQRNSSRTLDLYRRLTASGIDFDGIDWMLGPFSLYAKLACIQD